MTSLARLYVAALAAGRRRFDRETRFDGWASVWQGIDFDSVRYRDYCRLIGHLREARTLPTWFYLLAQRPALAVLVDRRFPFPLTGMVHLGNRAELLEEPDRDRTLDLSLSVAHAGMLRSGHVVEMTAHFEQGGRCVASNVARTLVRCPDPDRPRSQSDRRQPDVVGGETLDYAANVGRRYASISEDYNPIHLWPATARWFGFRRPIAHGMYSTARIAARIDRDRSKSVRRLEVEYRGPVNLPSRARLALADDNAGVRFALYDQEQPRLLLRGTLE